ncbi:hypothetical protein BHE74_00027931 [Ensete ventricosum]|nr:hypothetical protein BHE74_00027931 [Ensete ventricosum]RZS06220.1 hypothetical protein BHM03_00036848 [Ensete ventricosum]
MLRSTTTVPSPSRSPARPTWKASSRGSDGGKGNNHPGRENDRRSIWVMARRQVGPGQAGRSGVGASACRRARGALRLRTEAGPRWGPTETRNYRSSSLSLSLSLPPQLPFFIVAVAHVACGIVIRPHSPYCLLP